MEWWSAETDHLTTRISWLNLTNMIGDELDCTMNKCSAPQVISDEIIPHEADWKNAKYKDEYDEQSYHI